MVQVHYLIRPNQFYSNGPVSLTRNPPDYITLDISVLDNFILADELFKKALQRLITCILNLRIIIYAENLSHH